MFILIKMGDIPDAGAFDAGDLAGDEGVASEISDFEGDEGITAGSSEMKAMAGDIETSVGNSTDELKPEAVSENADINNPEDVNNLKEQANAVDPNSPAGDKLGDKMDDSIKEDKGKTIKDKVTDWMKDSLSSLADKLGLAAGGFLTYMALTGQNPIQAAKSLAGLGKGALGLCQKFFHMISQVVTTVVNIIDLILKYWWVIAIVVGLVFIIYIYKKYFSGGGGSTQRIIMVPEPMGFRKRRGFKNKRL